MKESSNGLLQLIPPRFWSRIDPGGWWMGFLRMRATLIVLLLALSYSDSAMGQLSIPTPAIQPEIQLDFEYRIDPSAEAAPVLGSTVVSTRNQDGSVLASRILTDNSHQQYFAYEVLIKPQGGDEYLVSFGAWPLEKSGLETGWTRRLINSYPPPQTMKQGDTASVIAYLDDRLKIADHVTIRALPLEIQRDLTRSADYVPVVAYRNAVNAELRTRGLPSITAPSTEAQRLPEVGRVSGTPRAFTATDAELKLGEVRITVNGLPVTNTIDPGPARGPLVWFYVPGRGRIILSLVPRPGLGFLKAGEARGGYLSITADGNTYSLESSVAIGPGTGAYLAYILTDAGWQPTAAADRGRLLVGTVGVEEVVELHRTGAP